MWSCLRQYPPCLKLLWSMLVQLKVLAYPIIVVRFEFVSMGDWNIWETWKSKVENSICWSHWFQYLPGYHTRPGFKILGASLPVCCFRSLLSSATMFFDWFSQIPYSTMCPGHTFSCSSNLLFLGPRDIHSVYRCKFYVLIRVVVWSNLVGVMCFQLVRLVDWYKLTFEYNE